MTVEPFAKPMFSSAPLHFAVRAKRVRLCSGTQPTNFVGVAKLRFATGSVGSAEKRGSVQTGTGPIALRLALGRVKAALA
jgi:hypothetical protein